MHAVSSHNPIRKRDVSSITGKRWSVLSAYWAYEFLLILSINRQEQGVKPLSKTRYRVYMIMIAFDTYTVSFLLLSDFLFFFRPNITNV